ncbi:hypothetical protein [Phenylobacterium sp.]|uniref:hypothetical protein n=1 Tax=Phenylobacterium sp. TaxID=1871053 RepID=UPI001206DEB6|nr:hypothetical protein [Phenylobacterium sp.]THD60763.1 MAG: hypothetical protein E8A49_13025 [Phenylobacterium sp.]
MAAAPHYFRTLGVHPNGGGFGWVVCEGPFKLVGSGLHKPIRGDLHLSSMRHFAQLVARYQPGELVIETVESGAHPRSERSKRLARAMLDEAADRGMWVEEIPRAAVKVAFAAVRAQTREEIAEAVARHYPDLKLRLPPKRKLWACEDRRMAIFGAAAAVVAHFHNGATALLDDLRDAA